MCQRVERSNDDPLRSLWMWERTKALNVLPNGLSSYKLMRREHFGSFWVERWWVRETEAEKEHRFQAIQTSALLVNDSRSVTDNVNITKIQLCCRTLDFWNKTQNRNECVFCCNNCFRCMLPAVSLERHQPQRSSNTAGIFAIPCFWFFILLCWWLSFWPGYHVIIVANVSLMTPRHLL